MADIGEGWQQWTTMNIDNNGQQCTTMDSNGHMMDNNGQKWTTMVNNGQQWKIKNTENLYIIDALA